MMPVLILFVVLSLLGSVLGVALKLTFTLFKWVFLAAVSIAAFLFTTLFAVPLLLILPVAAAVYLMGCLLRLVF